MRTTQGTPEALIAVCLHVSTDGDARACARVCRLNLLSQKKGNLAKAEKRKVAFLLRDDKEHNARILVEQIIRDDYTLESYDLIKQYAEMVRGRRVGPPALAASAATPTDPPIHCRRRAHPPTHPPTHPPPSRRHAPRRSCSRGSTC